MTQSILSLAVVFGIVGLVLWGPLFDVSGPRGFCAACGRWRVLRPEHGALARCRTCTALDAGRRH